MPNQDSVRSDFAFRVPYGIIVLAGLRAAVDGHMADVSFDVKTFVGVLVLDIVLLDVGMGVLVELLAAVGDGVLPRAGRRDARRRQ